MIHPNDEKPKTEFLLSFSDLVGIIKKNKRRFFNCALLFGCLALFYGLTKPIRYEAEGTFKEKNKSQSGLNNSLSAAFLMLSDSSGESHALSIMRSRKLLEDLVKDQNLQGQITKIQYSFPLIPVEAIRNNLLAEYAFWNRPRRALLSDLNSDLQFQEIVYTGEVPLGFRIEVLSPETFAIYQNNKKIGDGIFGQSFRKDGYAFTLVQTHLSPISKGKYDLVLLPLASTAKEFVNLFTIESDRNDKGILKITYRNRDRQQAAAHINALMSLYQNHIECEHQHVCEKQVGYLVERQQEMAKVLETMMQGYADALSTDLSSTGFATSEKAMEFLASNQHQLKQKLFMTTLEIQRLERATQETSSDNIFSSLSHLDIINKMAAEKRQLKQQADALDLVLRTHPGQTQELQKSFSDQLQELDEIKQTLAESEQALASLKKNRIPEKQSKLTDDSKYIFNAWLDKLSHAKRAMDEQQPFVEENCLENWKQCKTGLIAYLNHLSHYLNVYQRNIEEKLSHQQAPLTEFQGINLNIARDLYISYNRDLSSLESRSHQHDFILTQLDEPTFEISSLSTILNDPLSTDMITKTSNLILALKDQDNRSTKEQERLNTELDIQKGFLKTHIQQSMALLDLHQNFLKEKIQSLQSTMLSLTHEEISILDHQLKEYISNTLGHLQREKELISDNLTELRMEMAAFPQKWAAEQLIHQQMEINKSLVAEVSKLVESKNIANNLEKLQSAPVDAAFPPLHPKAPHLLLLTILGAMAGIFISFIWTLSSTVVRGIPVSSDLLETAGQHVSGPLTWGRRYQGSFKTDPLLDTDLFTLRRLVAFMQSQSSSLPHTCVLLEGKGPNYANSLAELLSIKGLKALVIDVHFEAVEQNTKGLLQYLEGKIPKPEILTLNGFDYIAAGGLCRHANEWMGSLRFKSLLETLAPDYDWILISSSASPASVEAETLLDLSPIAAATITDEIIHSLTHLVNRVGEKKNEISFITAFKDA
jgi:tyrosine-protein kinase Etk/Wzc